MSTDLPDALDAVSTIGARLAANEAAVFVDFDGTLASIVERPEDATISESMRATLARLARLCRVAVVSGRDLPDVRRRVGLDNLACAGSHGFDVRTAEGEGLQPTRADDYLPVLEEAEADLREATADIEGAQIERKRYSLAVHFRRVSRDEVDDVDMLVRRVLTDHEGLRLTRGKEVFDLQPDLDWHKGRAVELLLRTLELDEGEAIPLYLGDDVTDEDAFEALGDRGIGIVVDREDRSTCADYELDSPAEVRRFLEALADILEETKDETNHNSR